jgi:transketolase
MDKRKLKELRVFAEEIRVTTLKELSYIGFGHIGGSMSIVETLAVLYGASMRYDPKNPRWPQRDKLVVSKGHSGPAVYATLREGIFPRKHAKGAEFRRRQSAEPLRQEQNARY